MDDFFSPYHRHYDEANFFPVPNPIPYKPSYVKPCYNCIMPRDHFAAMYRSNSHRHDAPHDSVGFDEAVGALCGMLYSIVTLKAFFPSAPPAQMNHNPVKDAASGDSKCTQLTLW